VSVLAKLATAVSNRAPVPLVSSRTGGGGMFGSASGGASAQVMMSKMGSVGTLFAIVNRTSTAVAAQDWSLYRVPVDGRRDPGEDREEVTVHPALDLWRTPNPHMTTGELVEICQQHLDLVGEAALVVTKVGSLPVELWPVRPDRLTPVPHPTEYLTGWVYKDPDGGKIPLKLDEVIFIRMPNPLDPYRGMGPVQTLLADLDSTKYSAEWNRNFFLNSAEPGGVIEVDKRLDDAEFDEIADRWNEQHHGVSRAHRVAIIEHGKYVPRAFSMRDMQFAELRAVGRDTILEAYGISRATMGITDGVNFAAAKAARQQFAELLTVPRLSRWREALNFQLLPMYEPVRKPGARVVRSVEFDFVSPLEEDPDVENAERDSKVAAVATLLSIPSVKFDASATLQAFGLPDIPFEEVEPLPPAPSPFALPPVPPEPAPPVEPEPENSIIVPDALRDEYATWLGTLHPSALDRLAAEPAPEIRSPEPRAAADDSLDLTPVQQAWEDALDRLMNLWDDITAGQRAQLRKQIVDAIDDDDLAALASLFVESDEAADELEDALDALAAIAAQRAVDEAAEQDVTLTVVVPAALGVVAATVAALLAADLATAAGREALRVFSPGKSGAQVAGEVDAMLRERSDATARAQLGGALTGAQNRARVETFGTSSTTGSLYADETLDGSTCGPCRAHDGRFVCNTDDLAPYNALYTAMGGYVGCEGGVRCRGTVTGAWRPGDED
jgi:HK97 family phage portal protein